MVDGEQSGPGSGDVPATPGGDPPVALATPTPEVTPQAAGGAEEIAIGAPPAAEVPIKISREGAELLTALIEEATEKVRPKMPRKRGKPGEDAPET